MDHATTLLQPVSAGERIEAMDVLRGFALLGILLMNIEAMAGPLAAGMTGVDTALTGADRSVDALVYILVQGKFYTLFSLLFGMGFAVMLERATRAGRPFARIYLRRTLGLLIIGLGHATLIWAGDILVSYALMSLLLLLFRKLPHCALLSWAVAIYLVPTGLMLLFGMLGELTQPPPGAMDQMNEYAVSQIRQTLSIIELQRQAYGNGSFTEATVQRMNDTFSMMGSLGLFGFHVLSMFALGTWFVHSRAISKPSDFPMLYAALRWGALPIGLALMLVSWWLEPEMGRHRANLRTATAFGLYAIASLLMCLGYVSWIIRGLQSPPAARMLIWLAPAGRMALTNYLLQSLVCTLVFYGYGLGYFERMPRAWQPVFVFALFAAQVVFSHWWLARHAHGPTERLWRAWTYGGQARPAAATG